MHVFPLQYSQLPGVNCVRRCHGGSPASSDSHQLNIICTLQFLCNNYYWSGSLSRGWLARCRPIDLGLC